MERAEMRNISEPEHMAKVTVSQAQARPIPRRHGAARRALNAVGRVLAALIGANRVTPISQWALTRDGKTIPTMEPPRKRRA